VTDVDDLVQRFASLFQGRLDAYGVAGDSPYADHVEPADTHWGEYQRRVTAHLMGDQPMGVYPLRDNLTVSWGCTDLDNGEPDLQNALNIQTMFAAIGITAWVERSRTKGFHAWVFAEEAVPAATMRNAFLAVHQKLEVPAKEVNPKQVTLDGTAQGLGNWVRLAYPGGLNPDIGPYVERQVMLDGGRVLVGLHDFVERALDNLTPLAVLEAAAAKYVAPPPRKTIEIGPASAEAERLAYLLVGDAALFWRYGTKDPQAHDRSNSLVRFAHLMHEQDIAPGDAWVLLREADMRHGQKFCERADGDEQLHKILEVAYG
jgi:hypothetical protein